MTFVFLFFIPSQLHALSKLTSLDHFCQGYSPPHLPTSYYSRAALSLLTPLLHAILHISHLVHPSLFLATVSFLLPV